MTEYSCKLVNPVNPKRLRSKTWKMKVDAVLVEGFSIDRIGRKRKNGIKFLVIK